MRSAWCCRLPPLLMASATANRQIVWVAPGAAYRTSFRFGAVDPAAADGLEATATKSIRGR